MNHTSELASSTRAELLEAGRALFARRGYDGASIRAITGRANANLGAVTYHFGSKQRLYEAVLEEVLGPMAARIRTAGAREADPLGRVGAVIRTMFEYLRENPDMPQLMLQEIAAGKSPPEPVSRTLRTVSGVLGEAIRAGQAAGTIRAGTPELMAISSIIQPVHLTLVQGWLATTLGIRMGETEVRLRVVEHAVDFACAALRHPEVEP